ncbi:MAG TPA: type II toxin-antitoxin system VapC family toxin [Acidothermaceae bacterium]
MRVVLDTSVLLGPDPGQVEDEVAISAVSLAELHFGVLMARTDATRAERLRRLAVIERTFDALPVDEVVAREYGRLAAAVVAAGRKPRARMADLLIAATAVAHDATLWTRNPGDLVGLTELVRIQTPPR